MARDILGLDVVLVSAPNSFSARQTHLAGIALAAPLGGQNNQNTSGLANVVLSSQDNPSVNVLQLGVDDLAANLKQQHITSQRPTDSGAGATMAINPGGSKGTNQTGGAFYISDGLATGNAEGGGISFQLSRPGSSGSTLCVRSNAFAMADITGLSAFYPQIINNSFLGLASNPWWFAYIANLNITGGAGFWGHTIPGSQPAAPVTLADVITIIRGCGLSA